MAVWQLGLAMRQFLLMRIDAHKKIALPPVVILRCGLPQWDLRFPSYKCLKKNILTHTWGIRQKKEQIFYGQAEGVNPPWPDYKHL